MAVDYAKLYAEWPADLKAARQRLAAKVSAHVGTNREVAEDFRPQVEEFLAQLKRYSATLIRLQRVAIRLQNAGDAKGALRVYGMIESHRKQLRMYATGTFADSPQGGAVDVERVGVFVVDDLLLLAVVVGAITAMISAAGIAWSVANVASAKADVDVAEGCTAQWEAYTAARVANPNVQIAPPKCDGKRATPDGDGVFGGLAKVAVGVLVVGAVAGIAYQSSKRS